MISYLSMIFAAMTNTVAAALENIRFDPMQFVYNLKYLAIGLIGIFIVIGLIILVTVILNKFPEGKKKDDEQN